MPAQQMYANDLFNSEQQQNIKSLYAATLDGSMEVLNALLTTPEILDYLTTNEDSIFLLITAIKSDNTEVLDLYLEIPRFREHLLANPREHFAQAATRTVAMFRNVVDICGAGDNLDAWDNLAFLHAHASFNTDVKNYLLQNPKVFEFVECKYDNGPLYYGNIISDFIFDHYFPNYIGSKQRYSTSENFNFDKQETDLAYLILKYLIRNYSLRARLELRNAVKTDYQLSLKDSPIEHIKDRLQYRYKNFKKLLQSGESKNTYLKMIKMLLSIPSIRDVASKDNNQLLKLAIGLNARSHQNNNDEYRDIISLLMSIKSVSDEEQLRPVDPQYEMHHPIDPLLEYKKKHPSANTLAYERSVEVPGLTYDAYLDWGLEEFNRVHQLTCLSEAKEEEEDVDMPIMRSPRSRYTS